MIDKAPSTSPSEAKVALNTQQHNTFPGAIPHIFIHDVNDDLSSNNEIGWQRFSIVNWY